MLYILSGQDDFSIAQALEQIKKEIGDEAAGATTLDGAQVTAKELGTVLRTVPFFGGKRLIIIKGLLERFEPKEKSTRQKKSASPARQEEYKPFFDSIAATPDSTILVLVEGSIANSNPLFQALASRATVRSFPLLKGDQLKQWAHSRIVKEGGSISPQALDLLVKFVGGNLWTMASEIDKLVLYARGRRIEEEDVRLLVSDAQQANIFAMIDAIIDGKPDTAGQLLQRLLQKGAAPAYIMTMLARQVHLMALTVDMNSRKRPREEIQQKLGLADFAFRKTEEQAKHYSLSQLKHLYQRLLETDLAIKTGRYDPELALNMLVAELSQPGRAQAKSAR